MNFNLKLPPERNIKEIEDFFYKKNDQHIFFLKEKSLGSINDKLIKFYNSK